MGLIGSTSLNSMRHLSGLVGDGTTLLTPFAILVTA
jgi:hypothetical protein